jgi:Matrixin
MSRVLRALVALAVVAVAAAAYAFVRSTTGSPNNLPLFWKTPQVTYVVNANGFTGAGCANGAAAAALARASFPAWPHATRSGESQPCTNFKYFDGGDTPRTDLGYDQSNPGNNINLVVFRSGLCSAFVSTDPLCNQADLSACAQAHNCWFHDTSTGTGGILALTTATFVVSTGEILDADMELNGWNGLGTAAPTATGFYFTCASPGTATCTQAYGGSNCIEFDVGNTVTHEAGHMLGLDHVCVTPGNSSCHPEATMAPTAAPGDTDKRTLAADDIEGVCTIYPVSKAGGGGCSAGGGGVLSLAGVGLLLWRRRK